MKGFRERVLQRERAGRDKRIQGSQGEQREIEGSRPPKVALFDTLPFPTPPLEDVKIDYIDTIPPPPLLSTSRTKPHRSPTNTQSHNYVDISPPKIADQEPASTQPASNPFRPHKQRRHPKPALVDGSTKLETSVSSEPPLKSTNGNINEPLVVTRTQSLNHGRGDSPHKRRINSAEPQHNVESPEIPIGASFESTLDKFKHELEIRRHEAQAHEREIEDLTERYREQYEAMMLERSRANKQEVQIKALEIEMVAMKMGRIDLEAQCSSAKKERDNLKKHLSAMTQAYKARGLNYDDFAKMDHLKEEVARLSAETTDLTAKLSKTSKERDQAMAEVGDLCVRLDKVENEKQRQYENSQSELKHTEHALFQEISDLQRSHEADVQERLLQHEEMELNFKEGIRNLENRHHTELLAIKQNLNSLQEENAYLKASEQSAKLAQDAVVKKTLAITRDQLERAFITLRDVVESQEATFSRTIRESLAGARATLSTELRAERDKQEAAKE